MGYKTDLNELYHVFTKDEAGFSAIARKLQAIYPGNYTVVECYVPSRYTWGAKLVFEDEQEEIMFILQHA